MFVQKKQRETLQNPSQTLVILGKCFEMDSYENDRVTPVNELYDYFDGHSH